MPKKKNIEIPKGTILYGYDGIAQSLKKLADDRQLSHTYIFFGEPQVGKFLCAKTLAHYLEKGTWVEPVHPLQETLVVDMTQQEDDSEESAESIGIATARRVAYFLHQRPALSPYRVVIIRDGEWLTDQAQNALLKTLEEPPEHSVIILIATDSGTFLPAVASRAQKIYFKTLSDKEIEKFLREGQNDVDPASRLANDLSVINDDFDAQNHQGSPITTGSAPSSEARVPQSGKIRSRRASTTGLDFCDRNGIIKDTNLVQKSFGRIGRLQSLLEPQKNSEVINRLVRDICTPQTSDMAREKLVDAIIAFDQKNPHNLPALQEALMMEFYTQKKYQHALKEILQLITNTQTLTLSKRIHLKKLLCLIN